MYIVQCTYSTSKSKQNYERAKIKHLKLKNFYDFSHLILFCQFLRALFTPLNWKIKSIMVQVFKIVWAYQDWIEQCILFLFLYTNTYCSCTHHCDVINQSIIKVTGLSRMKDSHPITKLYKRGILSVCACASHNENPCSI